MTNQTTQALEPELPLLQIAAEALKAAQSELRDWHYDHPAHRQIRDALAAIEADRNKRSAAPVSILPGFVARKAEQAIEAATNPKGMHTNGPAMARIEASQLALLLRVAKSAAAPAEHLTLTNEGNIQAAPAGVTVTDEQIMQLADTYDLEQESDTIVIRGGEIVTFARSLLALSQQNVVEGFVIVPKEPTPEMLKAGRKSYVMCLSDADAGIQYRAMIAAAPMPKQQEGS